MIFNTRLLKGVDEQDVGLAKFILFSIHEGLNLIAFTHPTDITIRDQYVERTNIIVAILLNNGIVSEDYSNDDNRLALNFPLYVDKVIEEFDVEDLRKMWSHNNIGEAGKMGDPQYITTQVIKLMQERAWTFKQILDASQRYIRVCTNSQRYVRDLANFLIDKEGNSMIAAYISEDAVNDEIDEVL